MRLFYEMSSLHLKCLQESLIFSETSDKSLYFIQEKQNYIKMLIKNTFNRHGTNIRLHFERQVKLSSAIRKFTELNLVVDIGKHYSLYSSKDHHH